ncbi:MAG: helix-turn-helix domain-containing protein [Planctomycetota bacterium]|jgi:transcriptional regulator with XRE-family HTH domain|nr:helix-turn-helix domain-containing protein [Planctomycetota bacterium]
MRSLPARNKEILIRKIRHHKKLCFPGKGGGMRLAEEIGLPPQTVSNWLSGNRTPTFGQLHLLAKAFNASPLEMCGIRGLGKGALDISALRIVLDILEHDKNHNVNPCVTAKTLKSINLMAINEIKEMEKSIESRKE